MQRNMRIGILGVTATILVMASAAAGGFIEYFDRDEWELAVGGDFTTIDFTGHADGEIISEQYADLGAHFTDGMDTFYLSTSFLNDGWGADGDGDIVVEFDVAQHAIGADFPGLLQILLYADDVLIFESGVFGGGGTGFFAGIVAEQTFDRAIIRDPAGEAEIDDMHFSVPSPSALIVFVIASMHRRRRRSS